MEQLAVRLRELRKNKGLSQEEVAAYLQISFQSVSKWERGVSYPDIQMIVSLAQFYNISTDELLGVGGEKVEQEVDAILQQWEEDNGKGENLRNVERIRTALKRFPGEYTLLVKLVISLEKCHGTLEQVHKFRREAIEISEHIIKHCPDVRIRNDMLYNICYSYWNNGQEELAIERAKQLPGLIKSRENALVMFLEEEEALLVGQESLITLTRLIYHNMSGMFRGQHYSVDEKIELFQHYLENCDILYDKKDVQEIIHCKISVYIKLARLYQENNHFTEMLQNLYSVEALLRDSRKLENIMKSDSLLSNKICYKSIINAEYKKNWVLEQFEKYFISKHNKEIELVYRKIKEMY